LLLLWRGCTIFVVLALSVIAQVIGVMFLALKEQANIVLPLSIECKKIEILKFKHQHFILFSLK